MSSAAPVDPFESSAKRAAAELTRRRRTGDAEHDLEAHASLDRTPSQVGHAYDVAPRLGRARPMRRSVQGRVERHCSRHPWRRWSVRAGSDRPGKRQDGEQLRRERTDGDPILRPGSTSQPRGVVKPTAPEQVLDVGAVFAARRAAPSAARLHLARLVSFLVILAGLNYLFQRWWTVGVTGVFGAILFAVECVAFAVLVVSAVLLARVARRSCAMRGAPSARSTCS